MAAIKLQKSTEQSLIAALQQGRKELFGTLYDAYAPVMMGVISRIVPDTAAAEEVLQETFVTIWSKISAFDAAKEKFLSWGLAIARQRALEKVNSSWKHVAKETRKANFVGAQGRRQSDPQQLEEVCCCLEPQEKAVLEQIYLKGHSCTQTAAALGITEEMVKTILKKAFIHLKADKTA